MVPESMPQDPGPSQAAMSCAAEKHGAAAASIIIRKTHDSKLTLFPK